MLRNNLMLPTEALDIPEAIDFDGTNDYLSRASDLTGNADGKTFTFSAWIYLTSATHRIYDTSNSGTNTLGIWFAISSQGFAARAWNASGTSILFAQSNPSGVLIPVRTWTHILFSVDLTNTSNRHFYVNDVLQPITWTTYTNDTIDFTRSAHGVGAYSDGAGKSLQRISHLYLDYTYRNLSVEANRRLFITADRKPAANQQALNPILYLPLNDPTQPGKNLGTGGDFNLTGVVARSGRGPNQFNAPYSDLDGAADYLSKTGGVVFNSNSFTFACSYCPTGLLGAHYLLSDVQQSRINFFADPADATYGLEFQGSNAAGLQFWVKWANKPVVGRNYHILLSAQSIATFKVYINGIDETSNCVFSTALSTNIVSASGNTYVGNSNAAMKIGNVFFDTRYIDLSQPANLAKFVTGTGIDAKPADLGANGELPFGTAPLIYLPMYGNNAGKNYGTGGDFTVNSGPFTGARGPNEYWGNKADCGSSAGYLYKTGVVSGVYDGKTLSFSGYVNRASAGTKMTLLQSKNDAATIIFEIAVSASGYIQISGYNSFGTRVLLGISSTTSLSAAVDYHICLSVDLSDVAKRAIYVNNILQTLTWTDYANDTMSLALNRNTLAANWTGAAYASSFAGKLSEFYFTTDYIDFSQEANRLKFRDAFGNPVALQPQIEAGTLPNPAIYMRFDPANLGKNSGTGGDFTVNGTITDGGQL